MKFKEFLDVQESVKEIEFKIEINKVQYTVIRTKHLRIKRGNDSKPKDFKMTKNKYRKLFAEVLQHKLDYSIPITVTWIENGKSNAISFDMNGTNISVFGAIMNSTLEQDSLYTKAKQRLKISLK